MRAIAAFTRDVAPVFQRTVQGQADAIQRVFQAANDVVDNRGVGVLLWEPASFQTMFRPVPGMENYFQPLPSIDVFNRSHAREVVESRLYLTVAAGAPLQLPATVSRLTTATGEVDAIPVTWEPVDPAATRAPGQRTVTGSTEAGPVEAHVTVVDS